MSAISIRAAQAAERDALVALWWASARATHDFVRAADWDAYRPMVAEALISAEAYVALGVDQALLGFMALDLNMVDMLFVAPTALRMGVGRQLLAFAQDLKGPLKVDVNEQNQQGVAFYLAQGFVPVGRSEADGTGRPYPIMHMAMPA
ncbi:MAG: GNAT family N-acetyltransferase [Neisseriaceae bacterium]|nr:GNAT family N-acetyltransferase [Neisseriaceae bacterium]